MQLKKAERKQVKLRIGLSSPSGGGKTYSALKLARGMATSWDKVAVIDSENDSASLYSDLGDYQVLNLTKPFTPERYIQAIEICEKSGAEVIIIDSVSHEWEGPGGCLEIQDKLGGRYQDWAKVTPRHKSFVDKIINSSCHVITTARRKTDYDMSKNDKGKMTVTKAGMKEIQRDGFEYDLTLNFALQLPSHYALAEKDRTGKFQDRPEFLIDEETGKELLAWTDSGKVDVYTGRADQKPVLANIFKNLSILEAHNQIAIHNALIERKTPFTSDLVNEVKKIKELFDAISYTKKAPESDTMEPPPGFHVDETPQPEEGFDQFPEDLPNL